MPSEPRFPKPMSDADPQEVGAAGAPVKPGRKRWVTRLKRMGLLGLAAGGIWLAWVVYLARTEPAFFAQIDAQRQQMSEGQLQELAQGAADKFAHLVELSNPLDSAQAVSPGAAGVPGTAGSLTSTDGLDLTAAGPDTLPLRKGLQRSTAARKSNLDIDPGPHRIDLSRQEMNALLQTHLNEWASQRGYQMPAEISSPMVALDGERLLLGFRVDVAGVVHAVSAEATLRFQTDGKARLKVHNYNLGQLPVPVEALGATLLKRAPNDSRAQELAGWLDKLADFEFRPLVKLPSRHKARVVKYEPNADGVRLTVMIEPPTKY